MDQCEIVILNPNLKFVLELYGLGKSVVDST